MQLMMTNIIAKKLDFEKFKQILENPKGLKEEFIALSNVPHDNEDSDDRKGDSLRFFPLSFRLSFYYFYFYFFELISLVRSKWNIEEES
jgi:hypothetical protein